VLSSLFSWAQAYIMAGVTQRTVYRLRERVDLFKPAMTDASGRFTIRGITPGDYKLFAWTDLDPGSYFEPSLLQSAEPAGKPVHIPESSKETVNLTVIRGRSQ